MAGLCARVGCAEPVTAVLVLDPGQAIAHLVDVTDDPLGAASLCTAHADRVGVPIGWVLTDERTEPPEGVALLLGAPSNGTAAPAPDSPLLKRAFRVIS
jgi:hypothetical protein